MSLNFKSTDYKLDIIEKGDVLCSRFSRNKLLYSTTHLAIEVKQQIYAACVGETSRNNPPHCNLIKFEVPNENV